MTPDPVAADEVAAHLRIPVDAQVEAATCAAVSWVQNVRRCLTDPAGLWSDPSVRKGTVLYAALIYQKRAMPQGFPGYDMDVPSADLGGAMSDIYRLVGLDPVVA